MQKAECHGAQRIRKHESTSQLCQGLLCDLRQVPTCQALVCLPQRWERRFFHDACCHLIPQTREWMSLLPSTALAYGSFIPFNEGNSWNAQVDVTSFLFPCKTFSYQFITKPRLSSFVSCLVLGNKSADCYIWIPLDRSGEGPKQTLSLGSQLASGHPFHVDISSALKHSSPPPR